MSKSNWPAWKDEEEKKKKTKTRIVKYYTNTQNQ